jgi:hypothetical protein
MIERRLARQRRPHKPIIFAAGRDAAIVTGGQPVDVRDCLEITAGWHLYASHEPDAGGHCPSCASKSPMKGVVTKLGCRGVVLPSIPLACPRCKERPPLGDWRFEPAAFVAVLAIVLTNWPTVSPDFVRELETVTSSRVGVSVVQSTCTSIASTAYTLVGFNTSQQYATDSVNQCVGPHQHAAVPADGRLRVHCPERVSGSGANVAHRRDIGRRRLKLRRRLRQLAGGRQRKHGWAKRRARRLTGARGNDSD